MPEPTAEEIAAKAEADRLAAEKLAADAKAEADRLAAANAEKTLSQTDVDRIVGQTRQEARNAAEKELLAKLGIADLDSTTQALAKAKEIEDASKTELERALEAQAEAEKRAATATEQARTAVIVTSLDKALRDAELNPEHVAAAIRLVDTAKLELNGTEVVGLTEAVDAVKAQSPEWFGVRRTAPDASGGTGSGTDFRTATKSEVADRLLKDYNIRL